MIGGNYSRISDMTIPGFESHECCINNCKGYCSFSGISVVVRTFEISEVMIADFVEFIPIGKKTLQSSSHDDC